MGRNNWGYSSGGGGGGSSSYSGSYGWHGSGGGGGGGGGGGSSRGYIAQNPNSSAAPAYNSARANVVKSGDKWTEGMPTIINVERGILVVQNSTEAYIELTDRSLEREFDMAYKEQKKTIGPYMSPIRDTRGLETVIGAFSGNPLIPFTFTMFQSMSDRLTIATTKYHDRLILYYQRYNIIK
jgi:hypothetical protein